jgi:hypothetical protein
MKFKDIITGAWLHKFLFDHFVMDCFGHPYHGRNTYFMVLCLAYQPRLVYFQSNTFSTYSKTVITKSNNLYSNEYASLSLTLEVVSCERMCGKTSVLCCSLT